MRATQAIPLGDAGSFTRRARAVTRLRLALAAVALAAAAAFLAASLRPAPAPAALLPPSSSGVVVLDVSASISSDTYARIGATLDRLIRSGGAYGLVLFSDTAYQALPPHTPARELRPLRRFFEVGRQEGSGALPEAPRSPWTQAFGAGTRISTGLELALEVIRRDRLVDPAVLLVSDLDDDSGDVERVSRLAIAYRRAGIPLHVVGLNADPEDAAFIRRFLTEKGSFTEAALPSESSGRASRGVEPLLVALALIAAVGLGGIVFLSEPLRWRAT